MEFKAGDKVEVSFTGTIVRETSDSQISECWIVRSDGTRCEHKLYKGAFEGMFYGKTSDAVRGKPASWPPQAGDTWKTTEGVFFARESSYGDEILMCALRIGPAGKKPDLFLADSPGAELLFRPDTAR